jgi:recombination protein RecT
MSDLPAPAVPAVFSAVESRMEAFAAVLPSHVRPQQFLAGFKSAALANPDLMRANTRSVVLACMEAATWGLIPNGRQAAIVVRNNQAQFQPMIQGLIALLYRTGRVASIAVEVVYDSDEFDHCDGDTPMIRHKRSLSLSGQLVAAYSVVTMKDGTKSRCLMGAAEIERIMRMSPAGWDKSRSEPKGMWKNHRDEMWKKTVLHRHCKLLPMEELPQLSTPDDGIDIADAAWHEPQDYQHQDPDPPPPPAAPDAPETPEEPIPHDDIDVGHWKAELRKLRDAMKDVATVGELEEAYNAWDADHADVPYEVQVEVGRMVSARVSAVREALAQAAAYDKAKQGA